MAVYTVLDKRLIADVLQKYNLGTLLRFEPIASGIENTNYFVWTKQNNGSTLEFVLTVFENLSPESLPFFNSLTSFLAERGFSVPAPFETQSGEYVFSLNESTINHAPKFGVLVPKIKGSAIDIPSVVECQKIAEFVANMHIALSAFSTNRRVEHSLQWCADLVQQLSSRVPSEDGSLLSLALARYQEYHSLLEHCSQSVVHGDVFRDNVLFDKGDISGVIDFYHAGKTACLFDLAVIANDWAICFENLPATFPVSSKSGVGSIEKVGGEASLALEIYDEEKLSALLKAYATLKPLSDKEKEVWPRLLELAAFRFWLSRLKTKYLEGYQKEVKRGDVVKSPLAMKMILQAAMLK